MVAVVLLRIFVRENRVIGLDLSNDCIELANQDAGKNLNFVYGDAMNTPLLITNSISCCFENSLGIFFQQPELVVQILCNKT